MFWPGDAPHDAWKWLLLSGVIGFFVGDLALFRAFVEIGARLCSLLMALAPPIAALTTVILLPEEHMTARAWLVDQVPKILISEFFFCEIAEENPTIGTLAATPL